MIRGIGRAFARVTHASTSKNSDAPSRDKRTAGKSVDSMSQEPPANTPVVILTPSALGIEPPKVMRADMTELTLVADQIWSDGHQDKACGIYESLAKRYPTQPMPMVKLLVAYRKMNEAKGFETAHARLQTLAPSAKARALYFMRLFGDRDGQSASHNLLGLRLTRALELAEVGQLTGESATGLAVEARCDGMSILSYAVQRGDEKDMAAVLQLYARVKRDAVAEQVTEALTLAEQVGRGEKLELMLRSGLVPTHGPHLDRLLDKALQDGHTTLLQVMFDTCLSPRHLRDVDGVLLNLPQLLMKTPCAEYVLKRKLALMAKKGALHLPNMGGDDWTVMAVKRGGDAVAAMLDNGVDVERRDPVSGNTLLIEAAACGSASSVGVLMGRGATLTAQNNANLDALEVARLNGFDQMAMQIREFPVHVRIVQMLTELWGNDIYGKLNSLRTEVYRLNSEQTANVVTYLMPLLGFGSSLPDDFATSDIWTAKTMKARKLPAVAYAAGELVHWREVVQQLLSRATELTTIQWQGLTELLEGVRDPFWQIDVLRLLLHPRGPAPAQWKAVANSVSGQAYQNLLVHLRVRALRSALELRHKFGASACAALDYLNEIPFQGFDQRAYYSVMWDFVECAANKGDVAALAKFATQDAAAKNKVGLRRPLHDRVIRIERHARSMWQGGKGDGAASAQDAGKDDKHATLSLTLNAAHESARKTRPRPWTAAADATCKTAVGQALAFFGSATELQSLSEPAAQARVFEILGIIFGDVELKRMLHIAAVEAGRSVRRALLAWHPDKVHEARQDTASEMTALLICLRELLEAPTLRQAMIQHLDAREPQWRKPHA